MGTILIIFLVFLLLFIGAVVFIGWAMVKGIAFVIKQAGGSKPRRQVPPMLPRPPQLPRLMPGNASTGLLEPRVRCRRVNCHCDNPISARFCRRCGQSLLTVPISIPINAKPPAMARA